MNTSEYEERPANEHRGSTSRTIAACVFAIASVVLLGYLFDVLLLLFAAILLSVVIRAPTDLLIRRTGLPSGWALTVVLIAIVVLLTGAGWLLGSALRQQMGELAEQLPQMLDQVQERLEDSGWLDRNLSARTVLEGKEEAFVGRGLRAVSATFGAIAHVGLILFMTVLLAAQPSLYVRGAVRLVPLRRRERAREVLARIGDTLRRWLLGQLCLMALVATLSIVGLWLLDVRFALALGLLAGLLTFIPFVGPLLAAAVAILVSLADGVMTAVYVGALYLGIQIVEGMLEPIVQQKAVYLPPVLLLLAQIVLGVLVGALGVILATPLAAALMVAVQMLYVEDVLGDRLPEH